MIESTKVGGALLVENGNENTGAPHYESVGIGDRIIISGQMCLVVEVVTDDSGFGCMMIRLVILTPDGTLKKHAVRSEMLWYITVYK